MDNQVKNQVIALLDQMVTLDRNVVAAAVSRLQEFDQDKLFEIFNNLLKSGERNDQLVTEAMARVDSERAVEHFLPLLKSPDSQQRFHICGLLGDFGDSRATEPLIDILLNDSDGDVRYTAAWALGRVGDQRAIPALKLAEENDSGTDYEGRRISDMSRESIQWIQER